jgi:ubiquitin-like 1-activating enzyme E1 A
MTDLTAPADAKAINGTFPAEDAAGQTLATIVESEKISAGKMLIVPSSAPTHPHP